MPTKECCRTCAHCHVGQAKSGGLCRLRQIRVHAKFYIGEILFRQQEYDLAMQVFEEILDKDAFSGIVLKTLGRLVTCSKKLKLKKKKDRYYSMLHDFFGHGNG